MGLWWPGQGGVGSGVEGAVYNVGPKGQTVQSGSLRQGQACNLGGREGPPCLEAQVGWCA